MATAALGVTFLNPYADYLLVADALLFTALAGTFLDALLFLDRGGVGAAAFFAISINY